MKTRKSIFRLFLLLVLVAGTMSVMSQTNQNLTQTVCLGDQVYSVDAHPDPAAIYTWSLTAGGTITGGNGTPSITVNWNVPGGPYILSVFTTVDGCDGPPQSVAVTVVESPVAPTLLAMTPAGPNVCEGTDVFATFNPGTGGIGCSDEFEYSYDNSGIWVTYVSPAAITTTGHTQVDIRGRRAGCNASLGCNETPWVILATWNITGTLPVSVTITASADPVCAGASVTYTANVTNPGLTPTYNWFVNGIAAGVTTNTFTYIPLAGDVITCEVLSSETCATGNPATGTFTPTVNPLPATSPIWHN